MIKSLYERSNMEWPKSKVSECFAWCHDLFHRIPSKKGIGKRVFDALQSRHAQTAPSEKSSFRASLYPRYSQIDAQLRTRACLLSFAKKTDACLSLRCGSSAMKSGNSTVRLVQKRPNRRIAYLLYYLSDCKDII